MSAFRTKDFRLANGSLMPELEIAYETYGEMAPDRSNVVLVAQGITSSHIAAGAPTLDRRRGWYSEVIGPGKLFDTERYCVVSSNTLGSCLARRGRHRLIPSPASVTAHPFPKSVTRTSLVRNMRF